MKSGMGKTKTALVTGASGGIGLELARLFAADGYDLVLVARSERKLDELGRELNKKHAIRCTPVASDLSLAGAGTEIKKTLDIMGVEIDILVNNAGFGLFGPFAETNLKTELEMIQVNISAVTELTKLFLPTMVKKGWGRVLNVASTAAFQPGPYMAVYYATKAYVLSLTEAVGNELKGTGVTVTALCPGPTATGFVESAKLERSRLFRTQKVADSASVARAGYAAMMRGKSISIPGMMNWVGAQSPRFFPRKVITQIVRQIQKEA